MKPYFFVSTDGSLHDTRMVNWHRKPLRDGYSGHHARISTVAQFKATLRAGPYAWPGGYPLYLLTWDGAALCFTCGNKEARNIISAIADKRNDGWQCAACDTNWEDDNLFCDSCSKPIASAYGIPTGRETI